MDSVIFRGISFCYLSSFLSFSLLSISHCFCLTLGSIRVRSGGPGHLVKKPTSLLLNCKLRVQQWLIFWRLNFSSHCILTACRMVCTTSSFICSLHLQPLILIDKDFCYPAIDRERIGTGVPSNHLRYHIAKQVAELEHSEPTWWPTTSSHWKP